MRLGLLGPSNGDAVSLGRAAEFLLNGARVQRVIYLAQDGVLDQVVAAWAKKLVGDDPSDDGAWRRAAHIARSGTAEEIDRFVARERARLRLKALEALPEELGRTIETIGDRVAVLVDDTAQLGEEDILAAHLLFFGKSDQPMIRQVGSRWFVSPGSIRSEGGGVAIVSDEHGEVTVSIHDASGTLTQRQVVVALGDRADAADVSATPPPAQAGP